MFLITICFMPVLLSSVGNDKIIVLSHPFVDCDLVCFVTALCSQFLASKDTRGKKKPRMHSVLKSHVALGTKWNSLLMTDIYNKHKYTSLKVLPAQSRCK